MLVTLSPPSLADYYLKGSDSCPTDLSRLLNWLHHLELLAFSRLKIDKPRLRSSNQ